MVRKGNYVRVYDVLQRVHTLELERPGPEMRLQ